jgi:hypothetical protein
MNFHQHVFLKFALLILFLFPSLSNAQGLFLTGFWQSQLKLKFTTSAQTVLASTCSNVVTIQHTNSSNVAINTSNLNINLSGTGSLLFYSDSACAIPITSITINGSSGSFYFMDTAVGNPQITASATGYAQITQSVTENTNNFIWTGAVSTNWSTGGNWSGGIAPGASDIAVFDSTCITNCDAILSSAISIKGLRMNSSYFGTITQGDFNITIATSGYTQISGTFIGTTNLANNITLTQSSVAIAGGSFTAPVGNLVVNGNWRVLNSPTLTMPIGSTLDIECAVNLTSCYGLTLNLSPGSANYQNLILHGYATAYNLGGDTMNVNGNLSLGGQEIFTNILDNGTINVGGNITTITNNGYKGTSTLVLTGNVSGQTLTGLSGVPLPNIKINAGSNPVTLSGTIQTEVYTYVSSGSFSSTGSTLAIKCLVNSTVCAYNKTVIIQPGSVNYNNVSFDGLQTIYDLGNATMNISGNLTLGDQTIYNRNLNNGTLNVGGNITLVNEGLPGSAVIVATGNAAGQTITGIAGKWFPQIKIDTGIHPITLSGTIMTSGYTVISSGTLTSTGSTLDIECTTTSTNCYMATVSLLPGTGTYNDVIIHGYKTNWDLSSGTMNISGNLTLGDLNTSSYAINSGVINVGGNITLTNNGYKGTSTIIATGNAAGQTITGIASKWFPPIKIDTGTNPVTLSGTILTPNWTILSVGAFSSTGATLDIECSLSVASCYMTTATITPGNVTYNNVLLRGYRTTWDMGGGTMNVAGLLTIGDLNGTNYQINNATFVLSGGLTNSNLGNKGNAQIQFVGSGSQTITSANSLPTGTVSVNLTGAGTLTQASAITWSALNILAGSMSMAANALTITGTLDISSGASLTRGGGTLTYGSLINNGTLNP